MLTLQIHEKTIDIARNECFVRGTVGAKCNMIFDDYWDDYQRTVVFCCCGKTIKILDVDNKAIITIPYEMFVESGSFKIGVYGIKAGEVLPTLYSDCIEVKHGTEVNGETPSEYSPNEIDQLRLKKQNKLIAGKNITIKNNVISADVGSTGTTDYKSLENKPKINNIELNGNKSSEELGLNVFRGLQPGENSRIYTLDSNHEITWNELHSAISNGQLIAISTVYGKHDTCYGIIDAYGDVKVNNFSATDNISFTLIQDPSDNTRVAVKDYKRSGEQAKFALLQEISITDSSEEVPVIQATFSSCKAVYIEFTQSSPIQSYIKINGYTCFYQQTSNKFTRAYYEIKNGLGRGTQWSAPDEDSQTYIGGLYSDGHSKLLGSYSSIESISIFAVHAGTDRFATGTTLKVYGVKA